MKRILLISNQVFHYREKVYNHFFNAFQNDGYEFHVLSSSYQRVGYNITFIKHERKVSIPGYIDEIKKIHPDVVIVFLHLKDWIQLPIIYYCKFKQIPVIFWNKGLSADDPDSITKTMIYHYIHSVCDALITYTPDLVSCFQMKNRKKLFVAYNTLDFSDIDRGKYNAPLRVKDKYGVKEEKVILYVSRIQKRKRPELLADLFHDMPGIAVVYMGGGMYEELQAKINAAPNLYYLGELYGDEGNEAFSIATIFSTPGNIGLAANEALFWNIPIALLKGDHAPEIYYMKDGRTGFLADDEESFKCKTLDLIFNEDELARMRSECQRVYSEEVSIDRMYEGFIKAIRYCEDKYSRSKYRVIRSRGKGNIDVEQ